MYQEERRLVDPDTAIKLDEYIEKLNKMWEGKEIPYHFVIDDPSGNSYVQNPHTPARDVYATKKHYIRTRKDLTCTGYADHGSSGEEELKEERKEILDKDYIMIIRLLSSENLQMRK